MNKMQYFYYLFTILYLASCSGDSGGSGGSGGILTNLKEFFVSPIEDSVIALGSAFDTVSVSRAAQLSTDSYSDLDQSSNSVETIFNKFDTTKSSLASIKPAANVACVGLVDNDDNCVVPDLEAKNLQDCNAWQSLEQDDKFNPFTSVTDLARSFSWSSRAQLDLSFPGEFSYIASFAYACDLKNALDRFQITTVNEITAEGKTVVINEAEGNYAKAKLFIDDQLITGDKVQTVQLTTAPIINFNGAWPSSSSGLPLKFSRAFQSVAVNDNDLRLVAVHEVQLEQTKEGAPLPKVNGDISADNLTMKQKFTMIVSDPNEDWQGIAYFSSYKFDDRCIYQDSSGKVDFSFYRLAEDKFDFYQCVDANDNTIDNMPIYKGVPTDSSLFVAIIDKQEGTYLRRDLCRGGHIISGDNYTISSCALGTLNDDFVETKEQAFNSEGNPDSASIASKRDKFDDRLQVIYSEMNAFALAGQFPATVARFVELQGDFSEDINEQGLIPEENAEVESSQKQSNRLSTVAEIQASFNTGTEKIDVSWDSIVGATFYKLYRSDTTGDTANTDVTTSVKIADKLTEAKYIDADYLIGTFYTYWVKACNAQGCSSLEDSSFATTSKISASALQPVPTTSGIKFEPLDLDLDLDDLLSLTRSLTSLLSDPEGLNKLLISWDKIEDATGDFSSKGSVPYYRIRRKLSNTSNPYETLGRTEANNFADFDIQWINSINSNERYDYLIDSCWHEKCSTSIAVTSPRCSVTQIDQILNNSSSGSCTIFIQF